MKYSGTFKRLAIVFLAVSVTGCAQKLLIPPQVAAVTQHAANQANSNDAMLRAEGHMTLLHYLLVNGGEKYKPYFETHISLRLVLDDFGKMSEGEREQVREILQEIEFNKPATRLAAMEKLATILPSFKDLGGKGLQELMEPVTQDGDKVKVYRRPSGGFIFDLTS